MGGIVNLRRARKARDRRDKEAQAATNRALHGRTKAERAAEKAEQDRLNQTLDRAKREE